MELREELRMRGLEHYLNESPISSPYFGQLSPAGQAVVIELVEQYAKAGQELQLRKLLKHGLRYATQRGTMITLNPRGTFTFPGDHGTYEVNMAAPSCTCRLFRGLHPYEGQPGVCAHIMTLRILAAN